MADLKILHKEDPFSPTSPKRSRRAQSSYLFLFECDYHREIIRCLISCIFLNITKKIHKTLFFLYGNILQLHHRVESFLKTIRENVFFFV